MGLAERRALKDFQDNHLPALLAEIQRLAGFAVPVEANWDQLARPDYAHMYTDCFAKVYYQPVINALTDVGRDEMGRDALKAGLKKIVFANTAELYSADSAISFVDGVLTIDHDPCTNVDYVDDRAAVAIKVLEKGL